MRIFLETKEKKFFISRDKQKFSNTHHVEKACYINAGLHSTTPIRSVGERLQAFRGTRTRKKKITFWEHIIKRNDTVIPTKRPTEHTKLIKNLSPQGQGNV
jgi:hypothetical protein